MTGNAVVVNFSGGETSPRSRARFDQPWYQTSARKMLNFIPELQGPARFRPGFVYARTTRGGSVARLASFQINNSLAYLLEFTPGYMRVYSPKTQDLLTTAAQTITGITNASPAVMTCAAIAGMANGTEVILSGIVGMPQLNNRQVKLANGSGNTFQLVDPVTGANIDTTTLPAYSSGGTAAPIYEITTPYTSTDLLALQWASTSNTMYLVCSSQSPRKLTVDASAAFTLATFTRTQDPFKPQAGVLTISAITSLTGTRSYLNGVSFVTHPQCTVITLQAGATFDGATLYTFSGANAPNQINRGWYLGAVSPGLNTFDLGSGFSFTVTVPAGSGAPMALILGAPGVDYNCNNLVDSSGWAAYSGTATTGQAGVGSENPLSVAFYEGRLVYGGTNQRPDCFFLSRAPDSNGNSRYDDFTGGSAADFACFFQFAPVAGSTDYMAWIRGGPDYLFAGTFGGPYRVSGSGLDIPITPTSINVRQFSDAGAAAAMAAGLSQMFYIQRGGQTVRSIKVINPYLATFEAADMCLNAEQIGYSPLQRLVLQRGRPDSLWAVRADGVLCNMSVLITVQAVETLTGWARHTMGGNGKAIDVAVTQRSGGMDQLWVATQRTINGTTKCFVELMADDVYFPDMEDFFASSGAIAGEADDPPRYVVPAAATGNKAADVALWQSALYRLQGNYVHLDAQVAYDGSARGVTAGASLTPSAVGTPQVEGQAAATITLTASAAVFAASDVGSEIWVKPNAATGVGAGRATITAYTDSTHVTVTVSVPFNSTNAVAAGDWYFAASTFYGFGHLEGQTVAVVADGAVFSDGGQTADAEFPTIIVTNGTVTLPAGNLGQQPRAAVLRVGLPYIGIIQTHNLEMGGRNGPAQSKPRNISEINVRFMNSLGVEYGTDMYSLQKIDHRLSDATYDRPAPVFSGLRKVKLDDSWSGLDDATREKNVVIVQRLPLPAVVQFLDLSYSTSDADEGVPV